MSSNTKQLHWSQRVALVRHNLHAASRSSDFGFFKTLQAAGFMEGTNHVATLSAELGDEADTVLAAMDNLNAGLAYVHQDAFKNVYESLKDKMRDDDKEADKSNIHVDIAMQKNMADMAIDKMTSSAASLITQQPESAQTLAANVWIAGVTIVADCIEVTLDQMNSLECKLDDFIRLEESWNTVKASVVGAITGIKGVFSLMDPNTPQDTKNQSPRSLSIASAGSVFRRLSNAFSTSPTSPPASRKGSVASAHFHPRTSSVSSMGPVYKTPNYVRNSVSAGCPTSMPQSNVFADFPQHKLSVIPPTPAAVDDHPDPFDDSVPPVPQLPEVQPVIAMSAFSPERKMSQMVM